MLAAVIPAAGASRRMRFPKGAVRVGGVGLLELQCDAVFRDVSTVIVTLGWGAGLVAEGLDPRVRRVFIPEWWRGGQAESVRVALGELGRCRLLVLPVDVPAPSRAVLDALLDAPGSAVPCFEGRRGHPVLLGPDAVEQLREAVPEHGLRSLLRSAREVPVRDPSVLWNLNQPRDLARWLRGLRERHVMAGV